MHPIDQLHAKRTARDKAEKEYQEALEEVRKALGCTYHLAELEDHECSTTGGIGYKLTDAEISGGKEFSFKAVHEGDMSDPANWKEGDLVMAIRSCFGLTNGKTYRLEIDPDDGELSYRDDDDDLRPIDAREVKFHSRP